MEGDRQNLGKNVSWNAFQSTPSVWRETALSRSVPTTNPFQSTPSVWRETSCYNRIMESTKHFNPLPPYGGRRAEKLWQQTAGKFQSTPSVWRETKEETFWQMVQAFQSTPSVWRETFRHHRLGRRRNISIHSLRMEGDDAILHKIADIALFQSTPSVWRETQYFRIVSSTIFISIHSLRMEGDSSRSGAGSRPSISIHSLRMEGDMADESGLKQATDFNPLPPYGGRLDLHIT